MEILNHILPFLINYILPFLIMITFVVFIHEFGHYYFAKKYGVGVPIFSIGFGKEIFGYTDRSGTRWKFTPFLIGGYVKMSGDENIYSQSKKEEILNKLSEEEKSKTLINKPIYQRTIIAFGGPLANFLLAILIFAFSFMINGKDFSQPQIHSVQKNSPAYNAGIKQGDIILKINNNKVESVRDVSPFINSSSKEIINFKIKRKNEELFFSIKPNFFDGKDSLGNKLKRKIIGVKITPVNNEINIQKLGPSKALFHALKETWHVIKTSAEYLFFKVVLKGDISQLSGPVKIAKISGQVSELGILPFITLMAYISIGLGFMNLLPIPVLDGGHIMMNIIEKVRGKPLSEKNTNLMFRIGFSIVLFLIIFITIQDISGIVSG
tara:strand:- start:185 stop:1324 length:1140 start_codon:yes stop_codon:yes gene_type:complete